MNFDSFCSLANLALGLHYSWYVELPESQNSLSGLKNSAKISVDKHYDSELTYDSAGVSQVVTVTWTGLLTCLTVTVQIEERSVITCSEMLDTAAYMLLETH